jgi:hypothetical protein
MKKSLTQKLRGPSCLRPLVPNDLICFLGVGGKNLFPPLAKHLVARLGRQSKHAVADAPARTSLVQHCQHTKQMRDTGSNTHGSSRGACGSPGTLRQNRFFPTTGARLFHTRAHERLTGDRTQIVEGGFWLGAPFLLLAAMCIQQLYLPPRKLTKLT